MIHNVVQFLLEQPEQATVRRTFSGQHIDDLPCGSNMSCGCQTSNVKTKVGMTTLANVNTIADVNTNTGSSNCSKSLCSQDEQQAQLGKEVQKAATIV